MSSKVFPIILDYDKHIQNPELFLSDPELKQFKVRISRITSGPLRFKGGFAVVYILDGLGKTYAVRCWTQNVGDDMQHYGIIIPKLRSLNLSNFVEVSYIKDGILCNGNSYPILRMPWVEGSSLIKFIDDNCSNSKLLHKCADDFLALCKTLHREKIAHGDLQSDNIRVGANGEITLIDYDTLVVPGYRFDVNVKGLPSYQHPRRHLSTQSSDKDDYFSELVIYLTFVALAEEPLLWNKMVDRDTELLFRGSDFNANSPTEVFNDLSQLSPFVANLTDALWCFTRCSDIHVLQPLEAVVALCKTSKFEYYLNRKIKDRPAPASTGFTVSEPSVQFKPMIPPPGRDEPVVAPPVIKLSEPSPFGLGLLMGFGIMGLITVIVAIVIIAFFLRNAINQDHSNGYVQPVASPKISSPTAVPTVQPTVAQSLPTVQPIVPQPLPTVQPIVPQPLPTVQPTVAQSLPTVQPTVPQEVLDQQYIEGFFQACSGYGEINYYANPVNYFDEGLMNTDKVRAIIDDYDSKNPTRSFTPKSISITDYGDGSFSAKCTVDFRIPSRDGQLRSGTVYDSITVSKMGQSYYITNIKEETRTD